MADFNKPNRDQGYVNALPETRDNQEALAKMFNGVSALNIPVNSVQFAGGQFNLWDGANWNVQAIGISGGGTGATTAAAARTNLGVISETDGDAKYLKQASNLSDLGDKATARTELAVLGIANNLSDVNDAATAFDNIKQDATVSNKGVVEKATDIEMINGTALKFPDCETIRGWSRTQYPRINGTFFMFKVDWNGSSYNTISIQGGDIMTASRISVGVIEIDHSLNLSIDQFGIIAMSVDSTPRIVSVSSITTNTFRLYVTTNSGSFVDEDLFVSVYLKV